MAAGMLGDMLNGLRQQGGDAAGGMKKMTDVMIYVKDDMDHFLDENACAAAATMRFQANMLRDGRGEEPIRMAGGAEAVAVHATLAKGQNYTRLVDDLITEESSAWMMNRYSPGSVDVRAVRRDNSGEPAEIDAHYRFMMMGQPEMGEVRVTFDDGAPQCLYFSDAPIDIPRYRVRRCSPHTSATSMRTRMPRAWRNLPRRNRRDRLRRHSPRSRSRGLRGRRTQRQPICRRARRRSGPRARSACLCGRSMRSTRPVPRAERRIGPRCSGRSC